MKIIIYLVLLALLLVLGTVAHISDMGLALAGIIIAPILALLYASIYFDETFKRVAEENHLTVEELKEMIANRDNLTEEQINKLSRIRNK